MSTDAQQDQALLSFFLGPVQPFIEAARTVRDLWTGSYLVAWLTASAMRPVIGGQNAIISPAVEGNKLLAALLDKLRSREERLKATTACLPNRFVARVPADRAEGLANKCVAACREEWEKVISGKVLEILKDPFCKHDAGWARNWGEQIGSYFEVRTAILPLRKFVDEEARRLVHTGPLGCGPMELIAGMIDAQRAVRHVPAYSPQPDPEGYFPPKCSLLGSYEQMGPGELNASRSFWTELAKSWKDGYRGTRLGNSDRLCAVSLVKRFAWPAYFAGKLGLETTELRFSDTATVAAKVWLQADQAKGTEALKPAEARRRADNPSRHWSGQWLHWSKRTVDPDKEEEPCPPSIWDDIEAKRVKQGKPPTYYAILKMDGDGLGKLFRGEDGDEAWDQGEKRAGNISARLARFATNEVERIVEEEHQGELIYSGGDDTLALLPTQTVLACADKLRDAYQETMREKTVSAGIAVVHIKEDLRFSLRRAREAEKASKGAGRDALTIAICRRSGEHTEATMGWGQREDPERQIAHLQELVGFFSGTDQGQPVSDRWAYKLRTELPSLLGRELKENQRLTWDARRKEVRRLLERIEGVAPSRKQAFIRTVEGLLDRLHDEGEMARRGWDELDTLEAFVTLCQSASFLARGRDE